MYVDAVVYTHTATVSNTYYIIMYIVYNIKTARIRKYL